MNEVERLRAENERLSAKAALVEAYRTEIDAALAREGALRAGIEDLARTVDNLDRRIDADWTAAQLRALLFDNG